MADEIAVDLDALQTVQQQMDTCHQGAATRAEQIDAATAGLAQACGSDKFAEEIEAGDLFGYVRDVIEYGNQGAEVVGSISTALNAAVQQFDETEQGNTSSFGGS